MRFASDWQRIRVGCRADNVTSVVVIVGSILRSRLTCPTVDQRPRDRWQSGVSSRSWLSSERRRIDDRTGRINVAWSHVCQWHVCRWPIQPSCLVSLPSSSSSSIKHNIPLVCQRVTAGPVCRWRLYRSASRTKLARTRCRPGLFRYPLTRPIVTLSTQRTTTWGPAGTQPTAVH